MSESSAVAFGSEISARFPEISERLEEERKSPYLQMHELVEWLAMQPPEQFTGEFIGRITSFASWCESQTPTDSAETDIYTIFVVVFLENLFSAETTRKLLPHLISKQRMVENAGYLRQWVGEDDYIAALKLFEK